MGMIMDSGCDPLRHYNLWMQSGHNVQSTMIKVAEHQRGGSFLRIAWDPRISVGDSVAIDMEERSNFSSHEIGSLTEQYIGGLINLLHHQVTLLAGDS
jgi:hypothetical protein